MKERWFDKILKFHWIKLVILAALIFLFFIISKFFYVACIYGETVYNSSYIHYYGESMKCYASENFQKTDKLLCTNEECLNLIYNDEIYCVDRSCLRANIPSSVMFLLSSLLLLYLIITIVYSSIKFFIKKLKKKH